MRMLVTGGAGFIGSALAQALLREGHETIVIDDLSSGRSADVPAGTRFIEADVRDGEVMEQACNGVDVVFHEAALRSVPRSMDEPALVHEVNATGTLTLLEAASRAGVRRVVYASSSSVYGGAGEGRGHEDMPPDPRSPYAASKLAGEYYCRVWSAIRRVETVSLRYFNVFGPGQRSDSKYAAVFPAFVSALRRNQPAEIHWDGEQSRDFTFIDDVVRANLLAATAPDANGRVINIAGGTPRTIRAVYDAIAGLIPGDHKTIPKPKRRGDVRHSYADTDLAKAVLSWTPVVDWATAVARTVEWFGR